MDQTDAKRAAARAALGLLPERGTVGLGSGSTASLFIEELGELVRAGRQFAGVPTSSASAELARRAGIPLLSDDGPWDIDLNVDGADEVSDTLDVIKGGGGCHTREKIVNAAARQNIIVVDESKLSPRLGSQWAVPVEVLHFGRESTKRRLEHFGSVSLRLRDGQPWLTDSRNLIYDVRTGVIEDPAYLERELNAIPGVVETGLFANCVDIVLVAGADGVRQLARSGRPDTPRHG